MTARVLWALAAVAALAGCASRLVFEGGRAWNDGWREGKVEKVGSADELGYRHSYDCRHREGGAGREAVGLFAVVAVENMGRHRHHVVPVEAGKEPRVGDRVLTNWRRCQPPVAPKALDLATVGRSTLIIDGSPMSARRTLKEK